MIFQKKTLESIFFNSNPEPFFSSDFLLPLKNYLANLLTHQIIINQNVKEPLKCLQINSILNLGKALLDKGGLTKLQDSYQTLNLFFSLNFWPLE